MCDAHLVLAQAPKGLSCFFLPRVLPDGARNAVRIAAPEGQARQPLERLVRSRVRAAPPAGCSATRAAACRSIIEMVQHTRLDCAIGSAGHRHGAAAQALHHAQHRRAFGRRSGRAAADAERARRPRDRGRSRDRARCCGWRATFESRAQARRKRRCRGIATPAHQVLGVQARADGRRRGDRSASAATATSRKCVAAACTARRR